MIEVALLILLLVVVALLVALLLRKPPAPPVTLTPEALASTEERLRNELARGQSAAAESDRSQREELRGQLEVLRTLLNEQVTAQVGKTVEARFQADFGKVGALLNEVRTQLDKLLPLNNGVTNLQSSVTTFAKMLGNVKARGTWGEYQLGNILQDMLAPGQYAKNVHPNPRSPRKVVEYAIALPGATDGSTVWLPIDSKFPQEDFQRLTEAIERGDAAAEEVAQKKLVASVKQFAMDVRSYIEPPHTTNFAILFLPTEGLYQEMTRHADAVEQFHREYKVLLAGPTTLAALINALQMGFQTLAVQKNAVKVMDLLRSVKKKLDTFAEQNEKVAKSLGAALTANEENGKRLELLRKALAKVETETEETEEEQDA